MMPSSQSTSSGAVYPFAGIRPEIGAGVFIAPNAAVIGDVQLGEDCSVWFGVSVRGDVNYIRIGARSNVQDCSVVHVTRRTHPTVIGREVTIGHSAVIHGCVIEDRCLIGMGAVLLDGVVVEENCLIAAGALVPPNTRVPRGSLFVGAPGKVKRALTPEELAFFEESAQNYCELKDQYLYAPGER